MLCSARGEVLHGFPGDFRRGSLWNGVFSPREARVKRKKRRRIAVLRVLRGGSTTPTVVTSLVRCPRFFVNQTVSSGLVSVLVLYRRGSTTPTVVTSLVGCPRFSVSQTVSSGLVPVLVLYRRVTGVTNQSTWLECGGLYFSSYM
ncbi:hypothetical protein Taro_039761 [Colocasia esculenta]|uniref:Uncharacterized protein n=1 Tax=Colocasia esculenta TaxID=4460 RepID=A0A843WSF4_COLES|nr:hypothetical protein [Colocasia esculenta]